MMLYTETVWHFRQFIGTWCRLQWSVHEKLGCITSLTL